MGRPRNRERDRGSGSREDALRDRPNDSNRNDRSYAQRPRDHENRVYASPPSRSLPPSQFWEPLVGQRGRSRSRSPARRSPPRGPGRNEYHDGYGDGRRDGYRDHPRSDRAAPPADVWRPPQSDFTFRVDKPPRMMEYPVYDGYAPASGGRGGQNSYLGPAGGRPGGRRGNRRRGAPGHGGRRVPWKPFHPSTRALVAGGITKEQVDHFAADESGAKFRNLDEISDDEERAMDMSSHSSSAEPAPESGPPKKRMRTAENAPKWSNPDPYTALPPPDEQSGKQKDVVALIRKARIEPTSAKAAASTEAENFISFDTTDEEDNEPARETQGEQKPVPSTSDDAHHSPPPPSSAHIPQPPINNPAPPPPPQGTSTSISTSTSLQGTTSSYSFPHPGSVQTSSSLGPPPPLPPPPAAAPAGPSAERSGPLGSRKRTADDKIIEPPDYGQGRKGKKMSSTGRLSTDWEPKPNEEPCPWISTDHSHTKNVVSRLHKEVIDFYDYVRPRDFEQRVRESLVESLATAMRRDGRNFKSAHVKPFGSFMSGLYLPTADMDLVVCSADFMNKRVPRFTMSKSWLYKFSNVLSSQRIAEHDKIEVVSKARVPLVKYVDRATGLKVDVSFENLGGVEAIDTFLKWKDMYPAMPALVTVIKHFLLMRGLNEPVNGGIGGFSVICLVVSLLQTLPEAQSRNLTPENHLGQMLLEFFRLYGKRFAYENQAISLVHPIGYISKHEVVGFAYKNKDRISIIDPNNPSNDISGGSSNTRIILSQFNQACNALEDRMKQAQQQPAAGGILGVLMQGNYSSFREQRAYLKYVHEKTIGPCND